MTRFVDPIKIELARRMDAIRRLVEAGDPLPPTMGVGQDISRETRGLAIVLMYAAYENALTSLCRALLEGAVDQGVGNAMLRRGLKLFAVFDCLEGLTHVGSTQIWTKRGPELIERLGQSTSTIAPTVFPKDGSHMRQSQVETFCRLFELPHPGSILRGVWSRLDTVVAERNGIAHGSLTAEEVGRRYTTKDMREHVKEWADRWSEFLDTVGEAASSPTFFSA